MTFCTIVILVALVISASSLTGILQSVYGSLCHLPAMPSLNDSLVMAISPFILHRCYIRVLIGYSQLYAWGSGCPQPTVGFCTLLEQNCGHLSGSVLAFEGNGRRSMWWMAFMRAEYRWLKDSELRLWEGEHQPEYIIALPSPWFLFTPVFFFYLSLCPPPSLLQLS